MNDRRVVAAAVSVPAGTLHVQQWGPTAPTPLAPIVLLHDSLGCVALWRDFPQQLATATGRTVLAYDRLGFGASAPHPGRLAPSFIGDEAQTSFKALIDHYALQRYIVLGHSVGGGMAVEIAAQYPQACEAVITIAAQAFVEPRTIEGIQRAQQAFADPAQLDRLRRYHGDKAPWVLRAWIETWLSPAFASWTLDAAAAKVRSPLLAIHGDHDEYGSTEHPRRIAAKVQGPSRVEILKDCGHVPHRERPDTVVDLIADWLPSA